MLRGPGSIDIDATADGSSFRLNVAASVTAAWAPGRYWYVLRVSKDGTVIDVEDGELLVTPDFAAGGVGYNGNDHVRRVLDAIEAVLEKRATLDQQRYTINNRELWRTPIPELLVLRDRYRAELSRNRAAKAGNLFGRAVRVRFRQC